MESSRGAESATLAPPASSANKITDERQGSAAPFEYPKEFKDSGREITHSLDDAVVLPDAACEEDAEIDIEATFRRKLSGVRLLPKHERTLARRAAIDERAMALMALRRKREATRTLRRFLLRLLVAAPK